MCVGVRVCGVWVCGCVGVWVSAPEKNNRTYLEVRLRRANLQHARDVVRVPRPLEEDKEVLPRRAEVEDDALAVGENLVRRRQDGPVVSK